MVADDQEHLDELGELTGSVTNEMSGTVGGSLVQAGRIAALAVHHHYPPADPHPVEPRVPQLLPQPPSSFANRSAELELLTERLRQLADQPAQPLVLVLTGPSGVGASTLARHWVEQVGDQFSGGQLYVDFADDAVPGDVLGRWLRAFGVRPDVLPSLTAERVDLYRLTVARRAMLVLLDNVQDSAQVLPLLPNGPGSVTVITGATAGDQLEDLLSRGYELVRVGPMDEAGGAQLLAARCPRVTDEPEAARQLVRSCWGLPQTLRTAASRLARQPRMSVARLVTEVRSGAADQALERALDGLYRDLAEETRSGYRRLGCHPGAVFGLAAATATVARSERLTRYLLDDLCDAYLLEPVGTGRYRLPEPVRRHALSQTEPAERDQAVAAAVQWYARTAMAADRAVKRQRMRVPDLPDGLGAGSLFDAGPPALDWLDQESGNLVAAAQTALEHGRYQDVCHLGEACWALFTRRASHGEWERVHALAVTAARHWGNQRAEARARAQLARPLWEQHRFTEARGHLRAALALAEAADDRRLYASVLEFDGIALLESGQAPAALDRFGQALEVNRLIGSGRGVTLLTYLTGRALHVVGDQPAAIRALTEALDRASAPGQDQDPRTAARIRLFLGAAYRKSGAPAQAAQVLETALAEANAAGLRLLEARLLEELGELVDPVQHPAVARDCWSAAVTLHNGLGGRLDGQRLTVQIEALSA